MRRFGIEGTVVSLLASVLLVGCAEPIDMRRQAPERGTLGEEVYRIILRDLQRTADNAEDKSETLVTHRDELIWAIDTAAPEDDLEDIAELMLDLLPLYDDNLLPDMIRKVAFLYDDVVADERARRMWARSRRQRVGFTHPDVESGLIERIMSYPRLREFGLWNADLILDHDGIHEDGSPAPGEADYIYRLLSSIRDTMRDPSDPVDLNRNVVIVTEMLLQSDVRFDISEGDRPMWAVRPDARGLANAGRGGDGGLVSIFTDLDLDGLADIGADGSFVGVSSREFVLRPYGAAFEQIELDRGVEINRDALGRGVDRNADLVYDYLDLNQTTLGFLMRRFSELVERGILTDLLWGTDGLMGALDTSGEYPHYTTETRLLDLIDGLFQIADFDELPALLEAISLILEHHEGTLATLLATTEHNGEIHDRWGTDMEPNNGMLDDLLPYLYEMAQHKGFLNDLLTALQNPVFIAYGQSSSTMLRAYNPYVDEALDGGYDRAVQPCIESYEIGTMERFECIRAVDSSRIFSGVVDPSLPEGPGNTSLHQRLMHLVYDGAGESVELKIVALDLFGGDVSDIVEGLAPLVVIDDVAAAFFDSIAGNFCLENSVNVEGIRENAALNALFDFAELLGLSDGDDDIASLLADIFVYLSDNLGVHLDRCPTTAQLLRFFNLPAFDMELGPLYLRLSDPICGAGFVYADHHGDVLWAAEASGSVDALQPVVQVISDYGLTGLFVQMVGDLYRYFPDPGTVYLDSAGNPMDFAYMGARRIEPAMAEIFDERRLLEVIAELAGVIQGLELSDGVEPGDVVEALVVHLLEPEFGIRARDGRTVAERGDGIGTPMTRLYVLLTAFDDIDEAFEGDSESQDAWDRSSEALVDLLFEVIEGEDGRGRFADSGSAALITVLTRQLSDHTRRHQLRGDLHALLTEGYPEYFEELVTSRGFAALQEMLGDVRSNPEQQELLDDFLLYLTSDEETTARAGLSLLYALLLGTSDQIGYPGVASFYANLIDPDRRFDVETYDGLPLLTHGATVLRRVFELDDDEIGVALLRRALVPATGAEEAPFTILGRVIRQIHRTRPGEAGLVTAADLGHLYRRLTEYIRDDFRGMERAFSMIRDRYGERGPRPE
jgi:hypothetical protein